MKFSVLMSVYKNDNPMHFREALNSLCKSTFVPDEVVLVVDGPIGVELDNEIFEFKKNLNIKDVRLSSNCGLGRALSHGIEYCSYDWIARFDSDDICATDRFEKQIKYISNHPDVCLLGSWVSEFDHEPAQTHALRKVPTSHTEICAYAKQRNPFNHMSVMYKKSYVLESRIQIITATPMVHRREEANCRFWYASSRQRNKAEHHEIPSVDRRTTIPDRLPS